MSARPARLELRWRYELQDYPSDAVWSADGRQLIVGGGEGSLHVARIGGEGGVTKLTAHRGGVLALAWSGAGMQFASSGQDGVVLLWDARQQTHRILHQQVHWVGQLAFSANGKRLAAASERSVRIFDTGGSPGQAGAPSHTLEDHPGAIAALAWRPKSAELAAVGNGGLRLHRFEPALRTVAYDWAGACLTAVWSPDGRVLASGMQDGSVHFWRIAAGNQSQMRGYGGKVTQTSWSANSRLLATAANETLILWDFASGPEGTTPLQLQGHTARVSALAFRPSGAHLLSGGRDWRLMLWRPGSSDQAEDAHLMGGEVVLVRWSRDGKFVAVGDRDGTLSIFELIS